MTLYSTMEDACHSYIWKVTIPAFSCSEQCMIRRHYNDREGKLRILVNDGDFKTADSIQVAVCCLCLAWYGNYIHSQLGCSVAKMCPSLCDPMHKLLYPPLSLLKLMSIELVMLSHPLPPSSPFAFNLSQHQGLFQWVSSSHQLGKVLEFQLQHQSFQWIFRINFL